ISAHFPTLGRRAPRHDHPPAAARLSVALRCSVADGEPCFLAPATAPAANDRARPPTAVPASGRQRPGPCERAPTRMESTPFRRLLGRSGGGGSASAHGLVVRPSLVRVDALRDRRPRTLSPQRRKTVAHREHLGAVEPARQLLNGRHDLLHRQLPLFLATLEGVDRNIGKNAFVTLLLLGQQLRAACLRTFA